MIDSLNFITGDEETDQKLLGMVKYIADLALKVDELFPDRQIQFLPKDFTGIKEFNSLQIACIIGNPS